MCSFRWSRNNLRWTWIKTQYKYFRIKLRVCFNSPFSFDNSYLYVNAKLTKKLKSTNSQKGRLFALLNQTKRIKWIHSAFRWNHCLKYSVFRQNLNLKIKQLIYRSTDQITLSKCFVLVSNILSVDGTSHLSVQISNLKFEVLSWHWIRVLWIE